MQAGRVRLNQSIDVFVDRLLSAQVNVRDMSSILSSSGSAKEAQHEFLVLAEDVIWKQQQQKLWKFFSWRCFSLSIEVIIKFFPLILKSINPLLIFSYPFSCSFSHILVFILIICNPLILQNRLQQLLNSLSFRAIKPPTLGQVRCLFLWEWWIQPLLFCTPFFTRQWICLALTKHLCLQPSSFTIRNLKFQSLCPKINFGKGVLCILIWSDDSLIQ